MNEFKKEVTKQLHNVKRFKICYDKVDMLTNGKRHCSTVVYAFLKPTTEQCEDLLDHFCNPLEYVEITGVKEVTICA